MEFSLRKFMASTLFVGLCTSLPLKAQDESFIREMFAGKLREKKQAEFQEAKYHVVSPYYRIDLTGDGKEESFVRELRDGRYWFHLHNRQGERVFSHKFDTQGLDADLKRVALKNISPDTRMLMLYFYEGKASYQHFFGSARLYFLTIDNGDLESATMTKGPVYWSESRLLEKSYWRRKREISVLDLNGDDTKEVLLKHHQDSEVFFYRGNGKWDSL